MSDRILKKPTSAPDSPLVVSADLRRLGGARFRTWMVGLAILLAIFSAHLLDLVRFAVGSELYSYIVLIPFVSAYLIGSRVREIRVDDRQSWLGVGIFALFGLVLYGLANFQSRPAPLAPADSLALSTASFLAFLIGTLFIFPGTHFLKRNAFAVAFLVFIIPIPSPIEHWIEVFFQKASAEMAALFLTWSNVPVFRDGFVFRLPGIVIEVAQECSGIRSSLVLFLVSLVGGAVLLRNVKSRIILTAAVVPLAIIRNGFRILTISLLCVHVNPEMIDSPIHHRGGPIFFALSLIPFFGLLMLLRRWERKRHQAHTTNDTL